MSKESIQVAIGVSAEGSDDPMRFWIFDDGVKFSGDFTMTDLTVSKAVLLDLADAIQSKLNAMMS